MAAAIAPSKPKNQEPPLSNKSRLLQIGEHISNLAKWPTNRISVIPLFSKKTTDCYRIHLRDHERRIVSSHFLETENIVGPTPEDALQLMLDSPVLLHSVAPSLNNEKVLGNKSRATTGTKTR